MRKEAAAVLCAMTIACSVATASEGPFGLAWGASVSDLAGGGVELTKQRSDGAVTSYAASLLPEGSSFAKAYSVMIDGAHGLQRAAFVTESITNDLVGMDGKQRYDEIKEALANKYGAPVAELEYAGGGFQILPSEFYPCLALSGCGVWQSVFDGGAAGERVILSLNGVAQSTGYLSVAYEGPLWPKVVEHLRNEENSP